MNWCVPSLFNIWSKDRISIRLLSVKVQGLYVTVFGLVFYINLKKKLSRKKYIIAIKEKLILSTRKTQTAKF